MSAECPAHFRTRAHKCLVADRALRPNLAIPGSNNPSTRLRAAEFPWGTIDRGQGSPPKDAAAQAVNIQRRIFRWAREGLARFARLPRVRREWSAPFRICRPTRERGLWNWLT